MHVTRRIVPFLTVLLLALAIPVVATEEPVETAPWKTAEWSQWRGPERSGVSAEEGIAGWGETGPRELWRRSLGQGFSAIVVARGVLYTQFAAAEASYLAALSAADGKEIWRAELGKNFTNSYGNGPRATPTLVDGVLYTLTAAGKVAAVRAADGETVWQVDTRERYGARPPRWGLSGSPLVEGDLVIVNSGGDEGRSVLALDRSNGELRWSARDEKAGYAAPVAITAAETRQILVFLGDRIVSLNPAGGATYWELEWRTDWGVNATTPILLDDDRLFLSTGYDKGAVMLKLASKGEGQGVSATELWRNREMRNKFSSSVLYDGMLYGFDEGTLKCVDPETGTTRWRQRGLGHGTVLAVDGKLLVLSDRGKLVLAEASPAGYNEIGATEVFKTKTWTVPTLAGGRLYLRDETEIVALELKK